GKVKNRLSLNHRIFYVSLARGRGAVLITGEQGIVLWEPELSSHRILTGHTSPVWHAAYFGSGSQILSAGPDGTVRSWNLEANSHKILYQTEQKFSPRIGVSSNGQRVAWATAEDTISVQDASGGQSQILNGQSKIIGLVMARDGSRLASAAEDKS